jgi:hypothetical protein
MDLEEGVFTWKNPKNIAISLYNSAASSNRIRGTPYRSAMSMLCFYINRAGRKLNPKQKKILESAKVQLKRLYG